ncbi:MAG: hypothetical protein AAF481_06550 [Acidobacteriota bacterium]
MKFSVRPFILVAALLLVVPIAQAQDSPGPFDDFANHYKCYEVFEFDNFDPREVRLRDQFGLSHDQVIRPRYLCNPVSKNFEPIPHPEVHLVCFEIIEESEPREVKVLVRNQFGEQTLKVQQPELLCLPSSKEHVE